MKTSIYLLLTLGVMACGTVRPMTSVDSTKVEVHTETVIQHDTAYLELPVIVEKVATLDTTSTLENKYAKSEAAVTAGILYHRLETKPVSIPVKVETKTVYRDSLVYRDRMQTQFQTIEVEKKLNWWQNLKLKAGGLFLILTLIGIVYIIVNLFVKPKLFSL